MTMQVGMIGADGLVLVGDTKQFRDPPGRMWSTFHSSKIRISEDGQIAIACARNMTLATQIADALFSGLVGCDVRKRGKQILEVGTTLAAPNKNGAECIVAFAEQPSIYHFQLTPEGIPYCTDRMDRTPSGDLGNPAYFWAERYYKPTLSVDELVRLSAHIIVAAGELSSGHIGGLEVVTGQEGSFRQWSEEENKHLESCTRDLSDDVGTIILSDPLVGISEPLLECTLTPRSNRPSTTPGP